MIRGIHEGVAILCGYCLNKIQEPD